jgi:sec-independent protein translocase protein TatA
MSRNDGGPVHRSGTVPPMGGLGTGELLIILAVILVLFGGAKLPKLARSLGQAQNEFKRGLGEGGATSASAVDDEDPPATS